MIDINLVSFEKDLAQFELYNGDEVVTCHADVGESDLSDFLNGEFIVEPCAWFDSEERCTEKPKWFNQRALLILNVAFEAGYKEICESMIDDQGGM